VEGKSNVNQFSCNCDQDFATVQPSCYWAVGQPIIVFKNTRLRLRTANLDCGNKGMNRDLRSTLQAEQHPEIRLDLQQIRFAGSGIRESVGTAWTTVTATTLLSLAGETRRAEIEFRARAVGHEVYELVGAHNIRMTDFGIEPPTALLGLVKVEDHFRIHFKLWISVRNAAEKMSTLD
jgi:polyisoprenoid-binding protein YceI